MRSRPDHINLAHPRRVSIRRDTLMHNDRAPAAENMQRRGGSRLAGISRARATRATSWMITLALLAVIIPAVILAERFTPSITPTHLPLVNGISSNAMLLTRTSMPPGLTASSPAYVAPTADQLADEHAAWAWIIDYSALPRAFIVSRVAEIAVANVLWEQGAPLFFALRFFNGSVQIHVSIGTLTPAGTNLYAAPYWLPGVYSEMTAGTSHICFLTVDQHVNCTTTVRTFPAPNALMESLSAVAYTQIAAASWFTCGLRAVDQHVECFGAVGRDVNAPIPMNFTSS